MIGHKQDKNTWYLGHKKDRHLQSLGAKLENKSPGISSLVYRGILEQHKTLDQYAPMGLLKKSHLEKH